MQPFDLPPDPPTDLEGPPMPALVSGTSREFVGEKPLPKVIRSRTMLFLLGPAGVGKSTVAKSLGGPESVYASEQEMLQAINHHALKRSWSHSLEMASTLVVECPCFLDRRPAALQAMKALLRARSGGGRRTLICEPESGTSMEALMSAVHPGYRATIVLRFPIGRGRKRFAHSVCDELGVSRSLARKTDQMDPWSYLGVIALIEQRSREQTGD